MILETYTETQKEMDDERVFKIMRVPDFQSAIINSGITDPPKNRIEYEQARAIFTMRARSFQPNVMNRSMSFQESVKIADPVFKTIFARDAIYQWVYVSMLDAALGLYEESVGCIVGAWQTSCELSDDLFAFGTKMSFALFTTLLRIPQAKELVSNEAWHILGMYYSDEVDPRVSRHSFETHELNTDLFLILQFLARSDVRSLGEEGISLSNAAKVFDEKTYSRFKLEEWIIQKIKTL
jgi:hypothetical protein